MEAGLRIRVVTSVYFCATKLEAFAGRGHGDYSSSQDLEDFVSVVDGRAELAGEIQHAAYDVRSYIAGKTEELLKTAEFKDALPGCLLPDAASQARVRFLLRRMEAIAALV